MKKLIVFLMVFSLVFMSVTPSVFAVFTAANVGPTTDFAGDVNVPTGKGYYINGTLLAVGDITGAAASGANSDITSLTGLTTPLAANYGGTGVANNAASTITITGSYTLGLTLSAATALSLPTSGIVVSDNNACTDLEGEHLSITTGVLNVGDDFLLNSGDIGTGVYDFGGADSFEIPNKDADPAVTGQIILDTTVAGMTNGNLAFYDGTAIRYVVSLAAADIWSDDAYVVAYDATLDKFYMKVDAFSGNFQEHFMDIHAANTTYCHAAEAGTGVSKDVTTELTNPDVPRNVSITVTNVATPSGDVTVYGDIADGTTTTEAITIIAGDTAYGVKAFATITKYNIPATVSASDTVALGISDKIGLSNSFSAEADIYKKTVDGIDESDEISGNGDTTNNTLNCATIVANEDITIWYHN